MQYQSNYRLDVYWEDISFMAANFLVDTIGILGILSLAKKQGMLKNIKSDIDMLRSSDYRISESLYTQILLQNNEPI